MPAARTTLVLALAACLAAPLAAANGGGSTSTQSLRLARGARAVGLGGAYSAIASGSDALGWNPAGMNTVRALQASASHLSYVQDINEDSLQLVLPIYGFGAWGLGLDYLYTSDTAYDNWGVQGEDFSVFDFAAQLGGSIELPYDLNLGLSYKILRQGYGTQFSMGSSFDFGAQWKSLFKRLDLGLVAANLGTPMALGTEFGSLPTTFRAGLALHLTELWLFSADYDHQPSESFNKFHVGSELGVEAGSATVFARLGYSIGPERELGGLSGLAAGGGVQWGSLGVDYAWQPLGDLGTTHRISLTYSSWK